MLLGVALLRLMGVIFAGVCIIKLVTALESHVAFALACVLITGAAAILLFVAVPIWARDRVFERVDAITDGQMNALVRERTMQVRSDPYGKPILDKWHSEVSYFITHHVRPQLPPNHQALSDKYRPIISARIAQRVADAAANRPTITSVPSNMTPTQFEGFCAERLRACGWEAQLTPLGRDQGVDVIAEKNSVRVVLQCKLYSNPVGNKAVQEIVAGRIHQQAHHGAVVTNSTYTTSAKQLAATNGIRLLHHTDLPQLEQLLSQRPRNGQA